MRSLLESRTSVSGSGSSTCSHISCISGGMEASGLSEVKSKNAAHDKGVGPLTSRASCVGAHSF
eukprot:10711993-Alexandrium_andersonii.AAC.1